MSRLNELIQKLCPNGVDCYPIKELADVGTGSSNGNEAVDDGQYPFFIRSQSVKRKNNYEYNEEAIIIPGEGGIGEIYHYINGKYALHQRVYRIHFTKNVVDTKYAYHYFSANFKNFIMKKAVSATVKSIRKPMIQEFMLPVPPLEVQREIVRILDSFTLLTAELTAELTARKKQYEYYEHNLLFDDKYKRMKLSDLCTVNQGLQIPISKRLKEPRENCYRYITVQFLKNNEDEQYYIENPDKNVICKEDDILVTRTGSTGVIVYGVEGCFHNNFFKVTPNELIHKKYMYFLLRSKYMYNKMLTAASGGTVPDLPHKKFYALEVPVPTIDEQKHIVEMLEKFNELSNDITTGLPAEIKARQKQYEYYRDKLLNFKKLEK